MNEPYKLPEGWKWVRLGEVCKKIIGGGTPSRGRPEYWNGNIFWLSPSELEEGKLNYVRETKERITEEGSKNSNAKIVPPNSVLLSCTASVGKVAINKVPLTTNQQFNSFILNDKEAISEFVAYYLLHKNNDIKQLGGKTTFTFISKDEIAGLYVPLPPLETQRRIAAKLQEIMQEIDNARTACEKQLEAVKALPAAYLREVFESEEAKKWERKRLGDVLLTKPQYGLTATANTSGKGYIYLRITDIADDGKIKVNDLRYVELDKKTFEKYRVFDGDILIARSGSVGRIYLVRESDLPKPAVFASYLIKFMLNPDHILPEYFFYYGLSEQYKNFISEQIKTVAQPNINAKQYQNLEIPLPPLETQRRIANYLKEKMAEVEKLRTAIEKQMEAINALPQAYLRKAFRGEL